MLGFPWMYLIYFGESILWEYLAIKLARNVDHRIVHHGMTFICVCSYHSHTYPRKATQEETLGRQWCTWTEQQRQKQAPIWGLLVCRNGKIPNLRSQDLTSTLHATLNNQLASQSFVYPEEQSQKTKSTLWNVCLLAFSPSASLFSCVCLLVCGVCVHM